MIENSYYLEIKSLSKKTTRSKTNMDVLLGAMKHNMREIHAELGSKVSSPIDASRIHLNVSLVGHWDTAAAASSHANQLIQEKVKKVAINAGLGIEIIFSLANDLPIDYKTFFRTATEWAEKYFDVPLLSSIIHNDESTPHCHVILIPINDGKLAVSKLLGGKAATYKMQDDFYCEVAEKFGLARHRPTKEKVIKRRINETTRRKIDLAIFEKLRPVCDVSEATLVALINGKKFELLDLLNIQMPKGSFKGFVNELSTKANKKVTGYSQKTPIGHFSPALSVENSSPNPNEKETPISVYRTFNQEVSFVPQVGEIWNDPRRKFDLSAANDGFHPRMSSAHHSSIVEEDHTLRAPEKNVGITPDHDQPELGSDNHLRDSNKQIGEVVDRSVKKSTKEMILESVRTALMSINVKKIYKEA